MTQLWQQPGKNTIIPVSCRRQWSSIKISEQRNKCVHIVVFTRTCPTSAESCIIIGLVSGTWRKQAGGWPKTTEGPYLYYIPGLKTWKHINVPWLWVEDEMHAKILHQAIPKSPNRAGKIKCSARRWCNFFLAALLENYRDMFCICTFPF